MDRATPTQLEPLRKSIRLALLFEGGLALLAMALGSLLGISWWERLSIDAADAIWGVAATMPMLLGMLAIRHSRRGPLARLNAVTEHLIKELFAGASLFDVAIVSLLAGVGEELLFRGVLQSWLSGWAGPIAALLLSSAAFGLAHWISKTYAILAMLIGAYLGWLFWHFDNLLVPMVAHGLYDFVALMIMLRAGRRAG